MTGAGGQVASALRKLKPATAELTSLSHAQLDITDKAAVQRALTALRPDVLINTAAYTAVDKAESETAIAEKVNGDAPGYLAEAATSASARFLHISTDFVFDGKSSTAYEPDAPTHPLSAYGLSKLHGERRALEGSDGRALVLRTAWVYGAEGHNFVHTMLRVMSERGLVRVVDDQQGSPTWANSVAEALWVAAGAPGFQGIHHWTDAGTASWYDFATAIEVVGRELGLLRIPVGVLPITTSDYPTPARRPAYSVLDCSSTIAALNIHPAPWRGNLKKMLTELKDA